ncbi:MAG: diguanylate cyclase [Halofilum sp. (in: g-proteobacteria)]|nr:diguanylate cyclase [Halofilum sp. (in: g-proteobacteria)]
MSERAAEASNGAPVEEGAWARRRYRDQAQRDYFPRTLGLGMGAVAVGSVLYESGAAPVWWVLLFANGFVWPHVALLLAHRSADADHFEYCNLLVDSALVGMWIAVVEFNLLVGGVIATMVWMDNMAVGAERFFVKGLLATALGVALGLVLAGPGWTPEPTLLQAICSLPMLLIYPQLIGLWDNRLNRRLNEKRKAMERLSQLDGLSGVNNRQYWEFLARGEFSRARRQGLRCSLVLVDIDRFKEFNDTQGHVAGDEVIRRVGQILRRCMRREDPIGRYGGEEFGVVLTGAGAEQAQAKAEHIRETVNRESGDHGRITVSAGVAELTPDLEEFTDWIECADEALYRAKRLGRDRVASARD